MVVGGLTGCGERRSGEGRSRGGDPRRQSQRGLRGEERKCTVETGHRERGAITSSHRQSDRDQGTPRYMCL